MFNSILFFVAKQLIYYFLNRLGILGKQLENVIARNKEHEENLAKENKRVVELNARLDKLAQEKEALIDNLELAEQEYKTMEQNLNQMRADMVKKVDEMSDEEVIRSEI